MDMLGNRQRAKGDFGGHAEGTLGLGDAALPIGRANGSVLLLAPSRGLGGGIERYVSTVEAALRKQGVPYQRLDLLTGQRAPGIGTKVRFVGEVRRTVRASRAPMRLLLAHSNLLPVVRLVSGLPSFAGATVIVHGAGEILPGQLVRRRQVMSRHDVRVVAVSNYLAGALANTCPANVLHPGVSQEWYDALCQASSQPLPSSNELNIVTAFRYDAWRHKGLDTLIEAIRLLDDDRVRLTVCGSGAMPAELRATLAPHRWCRTASNLSEQRLAEQLAGADLFVLATCFRQGRSVYGEGFGLVLLEAQLAGTAVVAPPYGGSLEAFQPGLTGLSSLDGTPEALATTLATLLGDDDRRAEMGRAAAAWARVHFEPVAYGRHIVQTLLGGGTAPAGENTHQSTSWRSHEQ